MNLKRKSFSTLAATLSLSLAMLAGASVTQAAPSGTEMCEDLDRGARGLCRAAIKSGCAAGGRNEQSMHCSRLARNFTDKTGDDPVWLEAEPDEPAPIIRLGDL